MELGAAACQARALRYCLSSPVLGFLDELRDMRILQQSWILIQAALRGHPKHITLPGLMASLYCHLRLAFRSVSYYYVPFPVAQGGVLWKGVSRDSNWRSQN